ncbi:putative uncharacterized protein WWC2-AS2 [Manis pentadactyla]|uniref:putative uncharacterized protein WWC2-AS2 n=1 Tax=Manis pentadactyla TaxID=143292 RepID=UPI00255CD653|nr:putative uncharacterized protein WWC2-AS2 [Manis pentadactyla]
MPRGARADAGAHALHPPNPLCPRSRLTRPRTQAAGGGRPQSSGWSLVWKEAWSLPGVPQVRPIHPLHGAQGPGRTAWRHGLLGTRWTPRKRPGPAAPPAAPAARTHPRPKLAPSTVRRARLAPKLREDPVPRRRPSFPSPWRGALDKRRTGSLSSPFLPVGPEETEPSLRTRPAGSRGRRGAGQIPAPLSARSKVPRPERTCAARVHNESPGSACGPRGAVREERPQIRGGGAASWLK